MKLLARCSSFLWILCAIVLSAPLSCRFDDPAFFSRPSLPGQRRSFSDRRSYRLRRLSSLRNDGGIHLAFPDLCSKSRVVQKDCMGFSEVSAPIFRQPLLDMDQASRM